MTTKRKAQPEFELQKQVAQWLRLQYPTVPFLSDVRASMKLTIPQQVRSKQIQADNFACPDMMIFKMRGGYGGLFLELKAESPFRKDGVTLLRNDHLEAQAETIIQLQVEGYHAAFYWEFETIRMAVNEYLRSPR